MKLVRLASLALLAACATTGAAGEGNRDLPSSGVGPFRRLADAEVLGIAPFVLDDREARYRDPSAVVDGDDVVLFAVASEGERDVVVRTRATDARSFYGAAGDFGRKPLVVVAPDLAWEGGVVAAPSVLRKDGEWLLFYAGTGGIGLARSTDGITFRKEQSPVLDATGPRGAWETSPPRGPAAYVSANGRVRLLYAAGASIGEAESTDLAGFRRLDPDPSTPELEPVLAPASSAVATGAELAAPRPPFDTASVSDPCVVPRVTPAGRFHVRVLYTGEDASGATAIGFAARYGESGPLARQAVPVYAAGARERGPSFVETAFGTMLYVGQERKLDATRVYPGIAGAVAPANLVLPPPAEPPGSP